MIQLKIGKRRIIATLIALVFVVFSGINLGKEVIILSNKTEVNGTVTYASSSLAFRSISYYFDLGPEKIKAKSLAFMFFQELKPFQEIRIFYNIKDPHFSEVSDAILLQIVFFTSIFLIFGSGLILLILWKKRNK